MAALGQRAFELLGAGVAELPDDGPTRRPISSRRACPSSAGSRVEHPSLFRVAVQRTLPGPGVRDRLRRRGGQGRCAQLEAKVGRLEAAGLLGGRTVREATSAFHALCEGLAALELRGLLPAGHEEAAWRDALGALVAGFAVVPPE